jgi:hypothetical protein
VTVRLVVAAGLVVVAGVVAWWLGRSSSARRRAPIRTSAPVPHQVDRADFPRPDAPWLVVVFTSRTCGTCRAAAGHVAAVAGPTVATAEVPFEDRRDLHERYGIDAVPTTVVADERGVVRTSFQGALDPAALAAAVSSSCSEA